MSLIAPFTPRAATSGDITELVTQFDTPLGQYLGAKLDQGWWNSLIGQFSERAALPAGGFDLLLDEPPEGISQEDFVSGLLEASGAFPEGGKPPPERGQDTQRLKEALDRRGVKTLSETEYREGPFFREGMPFESFMTPDRARAKADIFDSNATRDWLIEQRQNGVAGAILGFGAAMAGGLADPINFVGLGWATRAVMTAKASGQGATSILRAAGLGAAESAVVVAAAEPVLIASLGYWGDDLTWSEAILDIAIGAATGGVISGAAGALRVRGAAARTVAERQGLEAIEAAREIATRGADDATMRIGVDGVNLAVGDLAAHRTVVVPPAAGGVARAFNRTQRDILAARPLEPDETGQIRFVEPEQAQLVATARAEAPEVFARLDEARSQLDLDAPEQLRLVDRELQQGNPAPERRAELTARAAELRQKIDAQAPVRQAYDAVAAEAIGVVQRAAQRLADQPVAAVGIPTAGASRGRQGATARGAVPTPLGVAPPQPATAASVRRAPQGQPEARVLDEITPETERTSEILAAEDDPDLAGFRELGAKADAEFRKDFEEADAEMKRLSNIEQAYQTAALCMLRVTG